MMPDYLELSAEPITFSFSTVVHGCLESRSLIPSLQNAEAFMDYLGEEDREGHTQRENEWNIAFS